MTLPRWFQEWLQRSQPLHGGWPDVRLPSWSRLLDGAPLPSQSLIPVILFPAGRLLLIVGARATMTRWTSLKASRPHKPGSWDLAASPRRLSTPTLATFSWKAQKSGTELSSQNGPRVPQPRQLSASWPRQKQHPPLQPRASATQTHGEVAD